MKKFLVLSLTLISLAVFAADTSDSPSPVRDKKATVKTTKTKKKVKAAEPKPAETSTPETK